MMTRERTGPDAPAITLGATPAAAAVEAAPASGWRSLARMDGRGWTIVAVIATGGAAVGAMLGTGAHRTALFAGVVGAMIAVSAARAAWGWLRGGSRRRRLGEGVLAKVEEYGGGFYGTGAAITLLILSANSMADEWAAADGAWDFLRGMSLEFWIGFSGESIRNAIQAGMWPLHWYSAYGLAAALGVAAAAWVGDAVADAWRRRAQTDGAADASRVEAQGAIAM